MQSNNTIIALLLLPRRDFSLMNETKPVEGTHGCRAPVNGLVIGATVGAVLALVFLLPYFGSGADGRIYLVAPGIVIILSLIHI